MHALAQLILAKAEDAKESAAKNDGATPPPGYTRAPNSEKNAYVNNKGQYWYPGQGTGTGSPDAAGSDQGGAGEDKAGAKDTAAQRASAHDSLGQNHATKGKDESLSDQVRAAHREAHAAHRRALANPSNMRQSKAAFMATNKARAAQKAAA